MVIDSEQYKELKKRFVRTVGHDEDVTVIFEEGRWEEAQMLIDEIASMQEEDLAQTRLLAKDLWNARKGVGNAPEGFQEGS